VGIAEKETHGEPARRREGGATSSEAQRLGGGYDAVRVRIAIEEKVFKYLGLNG